LPLAVRAESCGHVRPRRPHDGRRDVAHQSIRLAALVGKADVEALSLQSVWPTSRELGQRGQPAQIASVLDPTDFQRLVRLDPVSRDEWIAVWVVARVEAEGPPAVA